jgi:transposase
MGVRHRLQPASCQPPAQRDGLERATAPAPRPSAQRAENRPLAQPTLAGAKSKAKRLGQSIFFVDESGFYPLPAVVRTYAPRGQTPILREWLTRDHLSIIAAVSVSGRFYSQIRECAFDGVAVAEFLRHLLGVVPGNVLVIWDGAPIHRNAAVKAFMRAGGNERLQLEALPGYAPDLNPLDTGIWHWLKNVALANVCTTSLAELKKEMRLAIHRLRRKPSIIKASFIEAKLS